MQHPYPISKQTPEEIRARGWTAEARDSDGHLISCHPPLESGADLVDFWNQHTDDYTITIFRRRSDTPAGREESGDR